MRNIRFWFSKSRSRSEAARKAKALCTAEKSIPITGARREVPIGSIFVRFGSKIYYFFNNVSVRRGFPSLASSLSVVSPRQTRVTQFHFCDRKKVRRVALFGKMKKLVCSEETALIIISRVIWALERSSLEILAMNYLISHPAAPAAAPAAAPGPRHLIIQYPMERVESSPKQNSPAELTFVDRFENFLGKTLKVQ